MKPLGVSYLGRNYVFYKCTMYDCTNSTNVLFDEVGYGMFKAEQQRENNFD